MDIQSLFNGIAVVIDDEVNKENANINKLIDQISERNIPYLSFPEIPTVEMTKHFEGISFVLLDWRLTTEDASQYLDEGVRLPAALKEVDASKNIEFLKQLKEVTFTPVFIFTNEEKQTVIDQLKEHGLFDDSKPNFIFVENKANLTEDSQLFAAIETWVKATPSVYVLKQWEYEHNTAKNKLFWDFYERSPIWPQILWDNFKRDGANSSHELSEIITRNLYSRLSPFDFEETLLEVSAAREHIDTNELRSVLEGERFIKATQLKASDIFTGDVFREERNEGEEVKYTYWLNIRAQCDLVRDSNPDLYCLKGRVVSESEESNVAFVNGEFREKKNHVIVSCIDDGKIIEFLFYDLKIKKWNSIKDKRIGRLLPPYITRIQQLYSIYFQRQGIPRNPDEAFPSFMTTGDE